jgi:Trk K+ transport system NAD-binding subunit
VAYTYRNHIIVLGVGHVGLGVVRTLVDMGFEVVAIDTKVTPELDQELARLNVPIIVGDGRTEAVLEKARIKHADAFMACTSIDYVNLEAIMRARDMNPDARIVARMFDSRSANQLKRFMGVQAVMSSAQLAAPVFAGAAVGIEITQSLMVKGEEYSMVRLTVAVGSFMDGATIDTLQRTQGMDIVLHERDGNIDVHPSSKIEVSAGDTLVVFASHRKITDVVARNRPNNKHV